MVLDTSKEGVKLTIHQGIANLSLNRPEIRNAFDDTMIASLTRHLHALQHDNTVRILILSGVGEHFCAGADIEWMRKSASYSPEENHRDALSLATLLYTFYHFNKPTIAFVQGSAFGGALGLLACTDIVLADPKAVFCFAEVKLGLIPAIVSPYVIRAIKERAAKRYMLTAETFDARTAENLGLIHEIVEQSHKEERLNYFVDKLRKNAPHALTATKQLIQSIVEEQRVPTAMMEYTAELIAQIRVTKEAQEGLAAFLEKRKPNWQEF